MVHLIQCDTQKYCSLFYVILRLWVRIFLGLYKGIYVVLSNEILLQWLQMILQKCRKNVKIGFYRWYPYVLLKKLIIKNMCFSLIAQNIKKFKIFFGERTHPWRTLDPRFSSSLLIFDQSLFCRTYLISVKYIFS